MRLGNSLFMTWTLVLGGWATASVPLALGFGALFRHGQGNDPRRNLFATEKALAIR